MRVIAGEFRGRRLAGPVADATRPITDRVKETLFNILGHRFGLPGELPAVAVLDVFAGTGGLGIEAISRGAARCTFVERDRAALRSLRQNLGTLALQPRTRVVTDNAWTLRLPALGDAFTIIFADPPYRDSRDALRVCDLLDRLGEILAPDGVLVLRVERATTPQLDALLNLKLLQERVFGRMRMLFLVRRDAPASSASAGGEDLTGGEEVEEEAGPEDVGDDADR